ncbi:TPA: Lar family restriction alleviation protein [Burkholderia cenocepacia]
MTTENSGADALTDLLPCPFCGAAATTSERGKGASWHPIIACVNWCCSVSGTGGTRDGMRASAVKLWNTRADLAASPVEQPAAAVSSKQRSAINDAARVLEQNWEHATADSLREAFSLEAKVEPQPEQHADWRADFERQISAVGFDISREEFGDEYRHRDSANAFRWYYTGRLDEACSGVRSLQPAAAPIDLQGLRRSILTAREIVRDQDGMLSHPAVPYLDEDVNYETFFAAFGIEAAFIHMENDVDGDTYDRYFASNSANCSMWTPSAPTGDGWLLLEIYDTEDGPVALYVREKKPESMRERWKREKRESDAAAPAPADARVGLMDALRRAREELSIVEWENDPPSRVVKLFDEIDALLTAHPSQPESRAVALIPCPICGGEAIGHIGVLERVTIAPEPRAEVTDEQPSLTNPLTPYGILVRALRIVAQTSLYDMGQALLLSPAKLSAMEFGREPVTPEIVREVGTYFESLGIHNMRPALQFAIDAARTGEKQ